MDPVSITSVEPTTRTELLPSACNVLEKPSLGIPQLAEGIRNYARTRKEEKESHYVLFDKSTLSNVLGDEQEKFDAVMEYLEKSGRARRYPSRPGSWYID